VGDFTAIDTYGIENWQWILGINLIAEVYGISFFLPVMKSQKSGHIINISSAAAFSSAPNMGAYSATKAAALSFLETLYAEVHPLGINCSIVMPIFFKTNIMQYCRGVGEEGVIAQKLIEESGITAKTIDDEIIKRAGNKVFYGILPRCARFIYRIKKWFPMQVLKMNSKGIKNSDQFINLLRLLR